MYVPFAALALTTLSLITGQFAWLLPMIIYYVFMSLFMLTGRAENLIVKTITCENDRLNFIFYNTACALIPICAYSYLLYPVSSIASAMNLCFAFPHLYVVVRSKKMLDMSVRFA